MSPLLSVEDLHLAFGRHRAVEGVGFTVGRGETVALVGNPGPASPPRRWRSCD
ncbi:hypothetical protein [Seohaeicola sp.]|uniref:hypothetical protein n=1 Tax=Seohaeicola sp. TaxID=2042026 RepID=UPI003A89B1A2